MNGMNMIRAIRPMLPITLLFGCVAVEPDRGGSGDWRATNSGVHARLARAALERSEWSAAEENAREALRVDAQSMDAAMVLSRSLLGQGRDASAETAARRAVEIDGDAASPRLLLAECLLAQDAIDEACAAYADAIERGSAEAGRVLGALLLERGESAEAEAVLLAADERDGGVVGRLLLIDHERSAGRSDEAERRLTALVGAYPDDRGVLRQLEQVRFGRSASTAVIDRVAAAARAGRAISIEDRLLAAAELLRNGRGTDAAVQYRRLARALPDEPRVRLALGEALLIEHDASGAEAAFLSATRMDELSRAAWVGVSRARRALGRDAKAIESLERAVSLDPAHAPTRSLLVSALVDTGDLSRARVEAGEVRILEPGGALDLACRRLLASRAVTNAEGTERP